jgi:hypothetical protein
MRKREEFAVSLRKQNKRVKLMEKRAKFGTTKARPGAEEADSQSVVAMFPELGNPDLQVVWAHFFMSGRMSSSISQ